ncbi:hypothetical protein LOAG_04893 [Loa loa]|uniref:Uncharacterized protein n=1 Tax=Loa loa TaxID=7209 RepID=A0A1S0U0X2_LOALO|nr:hypothetical protein LOAG_04893 [Loa loa]EFO23592.1 hypothetical protein LOAG_04893 [Loa loa]
MGRYPGLGQCRSLTIGLFPTLTDGHRHAEMRAYRRTGSSIQCRRLHLAGRWKGMNVSLIACSTRFTRNRRLPTTLPARTSLPARFNGKGAKGMAMPRLYDVGWYSVVVVVVVVVAAAAATAVVVTAAVMHGTLIWTRLEEETFRSFAVYCCQTNRITNDWENQDRSTYRSVECSYPGG